MKKDYIVKIDVNTIKYCPYCGDGLYSEVITKKKEQYRRINCFNCNEIYLDVKLKNQ